jgi:hypothetical protein
MGEGSLQAPASSPDPRASAPPEHARPLEGPREAEGALGGRRASPATRLRNACRRVPTAAWICALVACLNAISWSFITPPFQVPDEPDHFAYVKQLAETGTRPISSLGVFSTEEQAVLVALHYPEVRQRPSVQAVFTPTQQARLEEEVAAAGQTPQKGSPNAGVAASEPPLYYALESIPYLLGSGGTLLDRLQLMRLLSTLMAGFTTLFSFLFLRETLPRVRWAWTVGALGVALSPLFGFMSGAVNPDGMLYAVSAALFYCLARAFRRGLTTRSALATGAVIAVGLLTKLNFVGLMPGAYFALVLLAVRAARRSGARGLRAPAVAAAIGCIPAIVFVVVNAVAHHATFGIAATTIRASSGSLLGDLDYIWQLYLPRLPGTHDFFPGLFTTRQIWFVGYIGRLGWLDTFFPSWVYTLAFVLTTLIAGLCIRSLLSCRATLAGRKAELAVYALMLLGVMVLVGTDSYQADLHTGQVDSYGQARYLLPMLPLLGAVLALAARGAGQRWGRATGVLIVLAFLTHDLFSQLQVIARFYG